MPDTTVRIPAWADPQQASVLDPWWTRTARMLGQVLGANDPTAQAMAIGAPVELPGGEASPAQKVLKAFHGSPHDFDQFSLGKIGTGEGGQAYGHGLYFAENPAVAKEYQKSLSPQGKFAIHVNGERLSFRDAAEKALGPKTGGDLATYYESGDALRRGQMDKMEVLSGLGEKLKEQGHSVEYSPTGRMFEVNLHASPDELLDWDKPLSQQSPKVQEAVKQTFTPQELEKTRLKAGVASVDDLSGENIYHNAPFGAGGSKPAYVLRKAGLKGIQYLDQGSRGGYSQATQGMVSLFGSREQALTGLQARLASNADPERAGILRGMIDELKNPPTKNFVIFDDKIIEIAKKYGVALPVAAEIYRRQQQQIQGQSVGK